ncbi:MULTISPECIES: DUF3631 domain-containing protein [Gordonia]|uniref:DUF3631 domain-containing protein n=1 Tax=Gordonia amicalis TaxID=89053 RepID=A0ABU4D8J9_9ACTN|nr:MULTISPECIES: DUF3631 domain-containing protein [Gordonia]ATD73032.1 hypothetical protein CNO18_11115 [Gordonia sp. 1D]MDV6306033.1 DUF3631 domain-containing protein [Gordonia amicalis]
MTNFNIETGKFENVTPLARVEGDIRDASVTAEIGLELHEYRDDTDVTLVTHSGGTNGAGVLDAIEQWLDGYLSLPSPHALTAIVLWAAHTWSIRSFYVTPRLVMDSPEPGSGKTRVLELLALLCRDAKLTISSTTPALYRRIAAAEDQPPTILQDEADAIWGRNNPAAEDLRALYNSGYKRGATVDRCEGDSKSMKVVEFPVFAPVAMAGLSGKIPATITSRAINIRMARRAPGEHVREYRERVVADEAEQLRYPLAEWMDSISDDLTYATPEVPEGVRDRPAEVWEALLAIADAAGERWSEKARAACRWFVLETDADELSLGGRLLRDIRDVIGDREAIFSSQLINELIEPDDSEWADLWGKPLDQRRLARELKKYGIKSATVRLDRDNRAKGYRVAGEDGFAQAWERYLPAKPALVRDSRDNRDSSELPQVNDGFECHASGTDVTAQACHICDNAMVFPADLALGHHEGCIA